MKSPLREERERRGWTLEEVAKKVGVSAAQISRIETDGVKAIETPTELVKVFQGTVSLDAICNPWQFQTRGHPEERLIEEAS